MGDEVMTMELRIREEDTMTRKWVAFVSVLLLSGTVAVAADWNSSFSTVDTDGNGSINRSEFDRERGQARSNDEPDLYHDGQGREQQRRSGRVVRGSKTEDGHRQGM